MNDPNVEWTVKHETRKMEQSALVTEAKKNKYIHDIKDGLGDLIKEEPNKLQKKPTWWSKLKKIFSND